jgi:hypothetical protein
MHTTGSMTSADAAAAKSGANSPRLVGLRRLGGDAERGAAVGGILYALTSELVVDTQSALLRLSGNSASTGLLHCTMTVESPVAVSVATTCTACTARSHCDHPLEVRTTSVLDTQTHDNARHAERLCQ